MKAFIEKMAKYWWGWFLLVCGCVFLAVVSVINDWNNIGFLSCLIGFVALFMQALCLGFALVLRQYWKAAGIALTFIVSIIIGFFALVLVAVGQHHPPVRDDEDGMIVFNFLEERDDNHVLSNDIPVGSWWTDGFFFYQVKQSGSTIRMEGGSLHEGGGVINLTLRNDTLRVDNGPDGYNTFSPEGLVTEGMMVSHNEMKSWSRLESFEVLIAYQDNEGQLPVAMLQRFDGDELAFEKQNMYKVLEGAYQGPQGTWTFLPDGTMKMSDDAQPQPYEIETGFDMATNILRLPDGSRCGVVIDNDSLHVMDTRFVVDEEFWVTGDDMFKCSNDSDIVWYYNLPFNKAQLNCLTENQVERTKDELSIMFAPLAQLNYWLMVAYLEGIDDDEYEWDEWEEEEEEEEWEEANDPEDVVTKTN